jgi:hypothetical protein
VAGLFLNIIVYLPSNLMNLKPMVFGKAIMMCLRGLMKLQLLLPTKLGVYGSLGCHH